MNATVIALKAFQWGEWAGQLYGERAHAESGTARSLGGYLRLSGTPDRSLVAEKGVTLARLVMARRLGHMPVALGGWFGWASRWRWAASVAARCWRR